VKALGIALKLTFSGMNKLIYPQTWAFSLIFMACVISQMNCLNKVFRFIHSEFERYFPTFMIYSILDNSRVIQVINVK
jgi:hypothetical protein